MQAAPHRALLPVQLRLGGVQRRLGAVEVGLGGVEVGLQQRQAVLQRRFAGQLLQSIGAGHSSSMGVSRLPRRTAGRGGRQSKGRCAHACVRACLEPCALHEPSTKARSAHLRQLLHHARMLCCLLLQLADLRPFPRGQVHGLLGMPPGHSSLCCRRLRWSHSKGQLAAASCTGGICATRRH